MRPIPHLRRLWNAGLPACGMLRGALVLGVVLASLGMVAWLGLRIWPAWWAGRHDFNDVFAQWSFARFAMQHPVAGLYDAPTLHAFQQLLAPAHRLHFPFPYPPPYLFAVWPLGWLDQWTAWPVWSGATCLLFLIAACAGRWRVATAGFLLLAPLSVLTFAYGQNGFLTSALILGGLRLLPARGALAGVLLGLASIKPQLGLLVPVALLAARQWTALATATASATALVLASAAAFGWEPWRLFLDGLVSHAGAIDGSVSEYRKPTVAATLVLFGMARQAAYAAQLAVAAAMFALVWRGWRRGVSELGIALLIVATFLATPYGFFYDMPMLTPAILAVLAAFPRSIPWPAAAILVLALLFPVVTTLTSRFFWLNSLALFALLGLILWRLERRPRCRSPHQES